MTKHVPIEALRESLKGTRYMIDEERHSHSVEPEKKSTAKTYLPIFLIFGFITAVTLLVEFQYPVFDAKDWMRMFMSGLFLTFSFFKLLDIPAFAASYSSYDIIAKRWFRYGYVYPFLELGLGILFLFPNVEFTANLLTLLIMGVSIIGVMQSVFAKREIKCACLGAVFELPMSTITIIEDALMIAMAGVSIILQ